MMKQFIITSFIMAFSACMAAAGDSIQVKHQALVDYFKISNEVLSKAWNNPALMETAHGQSMTEMGITARLEKRDQAFVLQKGTGNFLVDVEARSFVRLSAKSAVWGRASYMTGKNRDIKWNSVADYDILEPDILGDTVGGDTRREQYVFEGGYSTRLKRWHLGGEMLFRAEQEYRKVDPRMRSIVSDLSLRAGGAIDVSRHMIGLSVQGNIYRQTNSVDFYKPLGSVPEYQLMGLGEVYTRFSGDINDLYFKGGGIKLQLDVKPISNGVVATAWASQHHYESVARMLNSLPLTTLYNKEVGVRAGWKDRCSLDFAVWGDFKFNRRSSDQHIAGTSSSQVYPVIAHLTMYRNYIMQSSVSAVVGRDGITTWNVMASAGYIYNRHYYEYPRRMMKHGHFFAQLKGQVMRQVSKSWTLDAQLAGSHYACTTSDMLMPLADMEPHFIDMIDYNYKFLSAHYTNVAASLKTYYHIPRSRYSLYALVSYGATLCSRDAHQHNITVSLGVNL
jgi:hypothetical protein